MSESSTRWRRWPGSSHQSHRRGVDAWRHLRLEAAAAIAGRLEIEFAHVTADLSFEAADHGRRRRLEREPVPGLWKVELQGLADETGLSISVCHFPPGTNYL